jgi:hypothetical protein
MSDTKEPVVLERPDPDRAPTLDYRTLAGRENAFRDKGWWVAAAAAVLSGLALVQQALNLVLYSFPRAFTGIGSGLIQNGSTNWGMMAATLAMTGVSLAMFIFAVMYLRGRDTRRGLVRMAVIEILCSVGLTTYGHYTYLSGRGMPEEIIQFVWMLAMLVERALVPALVIVFFHQRAARAPRE